MTREELQTASDRLRDAAELLDGDVRERVERQAEQLATLATQEAGPDHGRLARHMNALYELKEETDGEASEHIGTAREAVGRYREGVEGV